MPSSRRTFVGAVGTAVALGGCVGGTGPDAASSPRNADGASSESAPEPGATAADESTPADGPSPEEPTGDPDDSDPTPEPTRGAAEGVSVSKTVGDVRYVPANETVEIVAAYKHTNHEAVQNGSKPPEREPVYEEIPWERWSRTECASVAAERVAGLLRERLGPDHGASVGTTNRYGHSLSVAVGHTVLYDRDGETVRETSVSFEELVAATPREVTATVTLDGRTATQTTPTWVEHVEMGYE